jgi:hypothetical protein
MVSAYERGRVTPHPKTLRRLAEAPGASAKDMLG